MIEDLVVAVVYGAARQISADYWRRYWESFAGEEYPPMTVPETAAAQVEHDVLFDRWLGASRWPRWTWLQPPEATWGTR